MLTQRPLVQLLVGHSCGSGDCMLHWAKCKSNLKGAGGAGVLGGAFQAVAQPAGTLTKRTGGAGSSSVGGGRVHSPLRYRAGSNWMEGRARRVIDLWCGWSAVISQPGRFG
jgi:hypothetical protein